MNPQRWNNRWESLYDPHSPKELLTFLAGMGAPELRLWAHLGGWIPKELAPIFRAAGVKCELPPSSPTTAVPPAGDSGRTAKSSTVGRPATEGVDVAAANAAIASLLSKSSSRTGKGPGVRRRSHCK